MRQFLALSFLVIGVAAPVMAQAPKPAVEVRVKSVNALMEGFLFLGEAVNKADQIKQGVEFLKTQIDDKTGLEGLDPARPWGLYAVMTKDVIDSPVIVMLPLLDRETFLTMLTERFKLEPKKEENDIYKLDVPSVPVPVFFRFTKDQVLVTIVNPTNLNAKNIIPEKVFFAEPMTSLVSAQVNFANLPAEVKKIVFGQWELQANDGAKRARDGETPAQTLLRQWVLKETLPALDMILNQGDKLTLALNVNSKEWKGQLGLQAEFTGLPGTALAKQLAALGTRPGVSLPTSSKTALLRFGANLGLPEGMTKSFAPVLDALLEEAIANAKKDEQIPAKFVLDALKPTLAAGELNAQALILPGAKSSQTEILAAIKTVKGTEIEKLAKNAANFVPAKDGVFEFDLKTVEDVKLHQIRSIRDTAMQPIFGTNTVQLGTSDDKILVAISTQDDLLAKVAPVKNQVHSPLILEMNLANLAIKLNTEDVSKRMREVYEEVFGFSSAKVSLEDVAKLELTGGKSLKLDFRITGKTTKFLAILGEDAQAK
jgi:hypothetical protein